MIIIGMAIKILDRISKINTGSIFVKELTPFKIEISGTK
jgi:hypothetical protein